MNIEDIVIYDKETIKGCFLTCFYIPSENRKVKFLVNEHINELDDLVKFLTDNKDKYFVGYNNLAFDAQVLEYIVKNYDVLINLPGKELAKNIWQFAQDIIEISNNGGYLPFNDKFFKFKQVDLFKILHGDNKNKIGSMSLKHLEYYMDMIIETFNFDHTSEELLEKEIEDLIYYCEHDVQATYEIYKIVRGDTENTQYKGKDQIGLRLDIKEEFNIECLNYSEAKIGDELFKKAYCEETNVNIKDLPRKGTFRKEIKLKHCIPKYVSFKTPELKSLLKRIENTTLKIDDKFEEVFTFYGTEYTLAQGGIHSTNQFQSYGQDTDTLLEDEDVSSMYPAFIVENGIKPYHIGKQFLILFKNIYERRLALKPEAKKDKKIKGIVETLKIVLNGTYGKFGDTDSWLYDREAMLKVTIGCQLSLMMLIEEYELNGISVKSANTDGVLTLYDKSLSSLKAEIAKKWSETTHLILENQFYESIYFQSVNDYIAKTTTGEIKRKGDFLIDLEFHKNKSHRIIPIALGEYFINENKNIEKFVNNHSNLIDFCIRANVNRNFQLELHKKEEVEVYNKVLRYYISNEGGELLKIKRPECTTNAAPISQVNVGCLVTIVNNPKALEDPYHFSNINRKWYIDKIYEIIRQIELGRKVKTKKVIKEQLSLF